MPLRNQRPISIRPTGCSDAVDGTNAFPGAMAALTNLVPNPGTDKQWVPRPAAVQLDGPPFVPGSGGLPIPGSDNSPIPASGSATGLQTFISALQVIGDIAYGMRASVAHPGFDEPFAFDLRTNSYLPIAGITAGNLPQNAPEFGPWVPPQLAQVAERIVFCHSGFPGGDLKFGWLDISALSLNTTANLTFGSDELTGNPFILGIQPGLILTAPGIPAGTTIVATKAYVNDTTGDTSGTTVIANVANVVGIRAGQDVAGANIPLGAKVVSVSGTSVNISTAATGSAIGQSVTFSGATITMSATATISMDGQTIAVAGGTRANPLWGAGDTNTNQLPSVPVGVAQYNGRAYFVCNYDGIPLSDSLFPCIRSFANQALATNDGLASTAIGPLPLNSLLGGVVQSLIVFEGISKMQQITGDPTTNNLAMNELPVATGTLAPNSIFTWNQGLGFISPEGFRNIGFTAQVSDPIGDHGMGVTTPFIYAVEPSRIAAAANADTIRFTVENDIVPSQPWQEWCFDITRKVFFGPHTWVSGLIQNWKNTFVVTPQGAGNSPLAGQYGLYRSDIFPSRSSSYVENGAQLSWAATTTLLPDNSAMAENAIVEATVALAIPNHDQINVYFVNEAGVLLSAARPIFGSVIDPLWGQVIWGEFTWGPGRGFLRQYPIFWDRPLVFKQGQVLVNGQSGLGMVFGNVYLRYQILGYLMQELSA